MDWFEEVEEHWVSLSFRGYVLLLMKFMTFFPGVAMACWETRSCACVCKQVHLFGHVHRCRAFEVSCVRRSCVGAVVRAVGCSIPIGQWTVR